MKENILDYLSRLTMLKIAEDKSAALNKEIKAILEYISILDEVDTEGVAPTYHVNRDKKITLRPDIEEQNLLQEDYLINAPSKIGTMVKIPTVIKGK